MRIQQIRDRHFQLFGPYFAPQTSQQIQLTALLVDPAYHRNVGDHMITLGELVFLERYYNLTNEQVVQCGYAQHEGFVQTCIGHLADLAPTADNEQRVALWHGGGNWGDLWRRTQEHRIPSFGKLVAKGYSVVGMPQSLFYNDATVRNKDTVTMQQGIESVVNDKGKDHVALAWREKESYDMAASLYPFVTNLLVPDIAFQLGPFQRMETPQAKSLQLDLLLFMRGDKESSLSKLRNKASVQSLLQSVTGGQGVSFLIVDWTDRLDIFKTDDYFFTESSIQLLSLGKVVVCDRLHAAILCYLSGIPFVYIDQMTGKISKTLAVALDGCADADSSLFARAQTLPEALQVAVDMLAKV